MDVDRALLAHTRGMTALRFSGRDVLEVLHRISTGDLTSLPAGGARTTLFCDFRGRLLHRALVVHAVEGVWLISDSPGDALAAFVDAKVFREDARLAEGPVAVPEAYAALARGAFGADERSRIAAGLPRWSHEIAEAFNPYEANLAHEVHLAKGCYTGQEALQRLVTYDSVRRQLVRAGGRGPAPQQQDILAGTEVAGRLTSATDEGEHWTGLAIVRASALEADAVLALADGRGLEISTPFAPTRPLGRP